MQKTLIPVRPPKQALIKVRCTTDLKSRVLRHAFARDSDTATVTREALIFYLAHHEMPALPSR